MNFCNSDSIILDRVDTWPKEVMKLLRDNEELIKKYHERNNEILKMMQLEPIYRINVPINDYQSEYCVFLDKLMIALCNYNLLGFHCTRLTVDEREDLIVNGLRPLSEDLIVKRIDKAYENHSLTIETYRYLKENNLSKIEGRSGMCFCFHMIKTFEDECGLYRLLTIWGGEAIYWNNTSDEKLIKELMDIGLPSIVIIKIPFRDSCHIYELHKKIIDRFLAIKNENHIYSDVDNRFTSVQYVEKILTSEMQQFHELVNYNSWLENSKN